jgi:DNA-binding NarL/FixJ family response regulator
MDKVVIQIAVVDDHILLRNGLANLINSFAGYHVSFEADNGKDFIAQLETHDTPDIVLLDISMPGMDGFETAAWIKKNRPATKMMVLSMREDEEAIIRMVKAGAGGYILKDSKPAIFREALDELRDKGFYMNDLLSNKVLNYVKGEEENKEAAIIARLTEKELKFLELACTEKTYKEIANEMNLSPRTVEGYRDDLFEKLGVISRVGLVTFAIKHGLHKL